jgi:tetratricopeptide (TPR) repeat protein
MRWVIVALCALPFEAGAQELAVVPGCGPLKNAYGPFDYRDPSARKNNLPIVEEFHFTPDVEMLVRGQSGPIIGDLNYTLRAFPNHWRALQAISRYSLQGGHFPETQSIPSAECYFERAIAYVPDDGTVHAIYASYLLKRGDREGARKQYEEALRLEPNSAEINYTAGLFFLELGDLERAKQLAKVAYDAGYPLPGLRNKIAATQAQGGRPQPAHK